MSNLISKKNLRRPPAQTLLFAAPQKETKPPSPDLHPPHMKGVERIGITLANIATYTMSPSISFPFSFFTHETWEACAAGQPRRVRGSPIRCGDNRQKKNPFSSAQLFPRNPTKPGGRHRPWRVSWWHGHRRRMEMREERHPTQPLFFSFLFSVFSLFSPFFSFPTATPL